MRLPSQGLSPCAACDQLVLHLSLPPCAADCCWHGLAVAGHAHPCSSGCQSVSLQTVWLLLLGRHPASHAAYPPAPACIKSTQ